MSKLKAESCIYCAKRIYRHDAKRMKVSLPSNNPSGANGYAHLSCAERQG